MINQGRKRLLKTLRDPDFLAKLFKDMLKIRFFENKVVELYSSGIMPGLAHLYIGEEAVAVGICSVLNEQDYVTSTHRGHGHVIARGADLNKMMAEILGKRTGYCKGKGGSMHIIDMTKGLLGANGIVAAGIPIATGAGYSAKFRKTEQVSVVFFGDAASNHGNFHESINMAAAWKLPVVYVCENNLYGISVDIRKVTNTENIADRACAYNIPGHIVDGNDVEAVYNIAQKAVERARKGLGPTLIECKTYRWKGHHLADPGTIYRAEKERKEWLQKCPIKNFKEKLIGDNIFSEKEITIFENEIEELIDNAAEFAINSPYPEKIEAYEDIYFSAKEEEVYL